jgi:6-phosphogluconate dehydrogenase (decarboxylating)
MTTFERVGFIGLGGMGRGLVKNLVAKGVAVTAYDLNPAAVAAAKSFGATVAGGVQEIRDNCRIIMICVNEAEDVEALMIARDGLLAGPAPGFIVVDHTTGSPQMVTKLDRMVREAGGRYAEAPMTRTPKHADIGKVNVLFGGEGDLLDDLRPLFRAVCRKHLPHRPARPRHPPKTHSQLYRLCQCGGVVRGVCARRKGRARSLAGDRHHLGGRRQKRHARSVWPGHPRRRLHSR